MRRQFCALEFGCTSCCEHPSSVSESADCNQTGFGMYQGCRTMSPSGANRRRLDLEDGGTFGRYGSRGESGKVPSPVRGSNSRLRSFDRSAQVWGGRLTSEEEADCCGRCGTEIDSTPRVDLTLKQGTRVCESCFVKETARPKS